MTEDTDAVEVEPQPEAQEVNEAGN